MKIKIWPLLLAAALVLCGVGCQKSTPFVIESENYIASESATQPDAETPEPPIGEHYDSVITFQDYEWGMSASDAAGMLDSHYYESTAPGWSDADGYVLSSLYPVGYRVYQISPQAIAGYDVLNLSMYFLYGHRDGKLSLDAEDSELYLVNMDLDVVDVNGAYEDLYEKLSSLYGEGVTSTSSGSGVSTNNGFYQYTRTTTEWIGAEDTGIKLTKSLPDGDYGADVDMFDKYVVLSYGKTNSDEMIDRLYKEYTQYAAEMEAEQRDTSNIDGL